MIDAAGTTGATDMTDMTGRPGWVSGLLRPPHRGPLLAASVAATWTGTLAGALGTEVARARSCPYGVGEEGYPSCPDGIAYGPLFLGLAGGTAAVVLLLAVVLISHSLDGAGRLALGRDLAAVAGTPSALVGGALAALTVFAVLQRPGGRGDPLVVALVASALLVVGVAPALSFRAGRRAAIAVCVLVAVAAGSSAPLALANEDLLVLLPVLLPTALLLATAVVVVATGRAAPSRS